MTYTVRWVLLCLLSFVGSVVLAQNSDNTLQGNPTSGSPESVFPALTGRVVDQAQILDEATEASLREKLEAHEVATSNQLVVVTIPDLQGFAIADYANRLGRHWGIGTADKNNGVILLIAPEERKLRIEVGYGLEGALPDVTASLIIQREIYPHFRNSDYAGGVTQGVDNILEAIAGEYTPSPEPTKAGDKFNENVGGFMPLFFLAVFFIPELLRRRGMRRVGNAAFPAGFVGLMATVISGNFLVGLILTVLVFGLVFMISSFKPPDQSSGNNHNRPDRRNDWDRGRRGGGFGGRGGFGGGGGSFGGGGASGSW